MNELETKLKDDFHLALRCNNPAQEIAVESLEAWDSLTHIKLVMELEMAFGISIGPDDIPELYKDFDTVAAYLQGAGVGG